MELVDIVDENNKLTGQVEEKTLTHKKCLWHRHVSSWIMNKKGEVLLQKRSADKPRNPSKWAKTGGHVDSGEDVKDAILREIKSIQFCCFINGIPMSILRCNPVLDATGS